MLDLDAIEARAEYKLAHIESQDISLRDITWTLQDVLDLVAELRAAREVVEAAQTALKAITDYAPGYEFPTPKEEADEEACEDCAAWRAKKHPIQYQCERHVHQKYRYEDRNKAIRAGQHWEMKRIAVAALDALAAYRAVVGEA
jgi:hypothetical protein